MILSLVRTDANKVSTKGELILGDVVFHTLELPWVDNTPNLSCIPTGTYKVIKHNSPKFGKCLKVLDVSNRTDILVHAGNTTQDTLGCILVGKKSDVNIVKDSKQALNELLALLDNETDITLKIMS